MSNKYTNSITASPPIKDLMSYLMGMKTIFPDSSSFVGTLGYELTKNPGDVPGVSRNNLEITVEDETKIKFIVEKYIRVQDKLSPEDVPDFIRNRAPEYRGLINPLHFSEFQSTINPDFLIDANGDPSYLSDFFGDLEFIYDKNIASLYRITSEEEQSPTVSTAPDLVKLIELNPDLEDEINNFHTNYLLGTGPTGFQVKVTELFLGQDESLKPSGIIGETGVYQGLRISVVVPKGSITPFEGELASGELSSEEVAEKIDELEQLSSLSKAFQFEDGNFILPLVSEEVMYVDQPFQQFDASDDYDLACTVPKIVQSPLYSLLFDKLFAAKMWTSMSALYCIHNFPISLGFGTVDDDPFPVSETYPNKLAERNMEHIDPADPDDDFNGIYNMRTKNTLRKKFASLYLSNDIDGQDSGTDDDEERKLSFANPFDKMSLGILLPKIPLFQRRRIVSNPYDMNGEECANPLKDLE